jgi:hypothetical protein
MYPEYEKNQVGRGSTKEPPNSGGDSEAFSFVDNDFRLCESAGPNVD